MKDSQNITIGLLLVTTIILGALVIGAMTSRSSTVFADTPVSGGDYIMGPGAISSSTDLIYVIDIASQQLNAYYSNTNTNTIDVIDTVDLRRAFGE